MALSVLRTPVAAGNRAYRPPCSTRLCPSAWNTWSEWPAITDIDRTRRPLRRSPSAASGGRVRIGRRRSPAPAGLPAAGERLRRRSATRRRRGRGPRPPAIGPGRRLRRHDRPPRRRPGARRGSGDRCAARGGPQVGAQQGLRRRRGGARPTIPAERTRWERHGFRSKTVRVMTRTVARGEAAAARRTDIERPPELRQARRHHRPKESTWARTSPSSWTWRTSSMRPRRPASTSTTSRCSSRPPQVAISSGPTPTPGLDPDNENQRNFHDFLRRQQLQGRQQGHPQVRRRQGQGEPRHRARRRHDEDGPQPRRRDRRLRRRRLRPGHPGGPGDGRPRRGHQLPRQHQLGPDRGRRPVHRHRPDRPGREGLIALRPAGGRRRRGPVDDRGARQADRGHRRGPRSRPWTGAPRRGRADPGRREDRSWQAADGGRRRGRGRRGWCTGRAPDARRAAGGEALPGRRRRRGRGSVSGRRGRARRRWRLAAAFDRADGPDGPDGEDGRRRRRRGGRGRGRGRGRGEGEAIPVEDAAAPSRAREDDADRDDIPAAPRAPRRPPSVPSGIRRSACLPRRAPFARSPRATSSTTSRRSPSTSSRNGAATAGRRTAVAVHEAAGAATRPRSTASATAAVAVAGSTATPT